MNGIVSILEMQNPGYYKIIRKNTKNRQKMSVYYHASRRDLVIQMFLFFFIVSKSHFSKLRPLFVRNMKGNRVCQYGYDKKGNW